MSIEDYDARVITLAEKINSLLPGEDIHIALAALLIVTGTAITKAIARTPFVTPPCVLNLLRAIQDNLQFLSPQIGDDEL